MSIKNKRNILFNQIPNQSPTMMWSWDKSHAANFKVYMHLLAIICEVSVLNAPGNDKMFIWI